VLITFEGIDGSGKGTLAARLRQELQDRGELAAVFSFPQYGRNPFSIEVARYLNGGVDVHGLDSARYAALLYAADRATARSEIEGLLEQGAYVICDRYVESNLAHQVARAQNVNRTELASWMREVEYQGFQMPRPDRIFLLDVDVDLARQRVRAKSKRTYTEHAEDIHEKDYSYLNNTRRAYLELAIEDPLRWRVLNVAVDGVERTPQELVQRCLVDLQPSHHVP
jgi:dTMP kinase